MVSTHKKFMVGAYVSSISLRRWSPEDETVFFQNLRERKLIRGLEHGFYGKLHRYDDAWFLANVHPDWEYAFTTLPGMCDLMAADAKVGLASKDPAGREKAIEFIRAANEAVKKLNKHHQRKSVLAVQVHSAPAGLGDREQFAKSLATIASWDWDGAKILVEHCDSFRPNGGHKKGYLPLEDEVWAIESVLKSKPLTPVAAMLNWARSVIEAEDVNHVLAHIDLLKARGLLKAFLFSGTSATKDSPFLYYGDKHAPAPTPSNGKILAADSIMTVDEMKKSLARLPLSELDYTGFKIMPAPLPEDSRESLVYIDYLLEFLDGQLNS